MFDRINKGIYWDRSWKLVEGCTQVSEACRNCWSARETLVRSHHNNPKISERLKGLITKGQFNGKTRLRPDNLSLPKRIQKPTVFAIWNDLFHEKVPFEFIAAAFGIMAWADQHIYLVLTKRPERMLEWFKWIEKQTIKHFAQPHPALKCAFHATKFEVPHKILLALSDKSDSTWPLHNVWLGVTAENQSTANERIPLLLQIPAAKWFVSIEPMLGQVDLSVWIEGDECPDPLCDDSICDHFCQSREQRLHWVIVGGETGPEARLLNPDWVRLVKVQCELAGIPFFFKGWGEWVLPPRGKIGKPQRVGKKNAGAILDGKEYREVPR